MGNAGRYEDGVADAEPNPVERRKHPVDVLMLDPVGHLLFGHVTTETEVGDPGIGTDITQSGHDPLILEGEKAASRGFLARLGASLSQNEFAIAAALATDATVGTLGAATAITVAGTFADDAIRSRRDTGPVRIWSSLVAHNQRVNDEMRGVQYAPAAAPAAPNTPWGIPREPGMSISVTAGQMIWDADPRTLPDEDARSRLGVYGPCRCGSGHKFKFCCAGLR